MGRKRISKRSPFHIDGSMMDNAQHCIVAVQAKGWPNHHVPRSGVGGVQCMRKQGSRALEGKPRRHQGHDPKRDALGEKKPKHSTFYSVYPL